MHLAEELVFNFLYVQNFLKQRQSRPVNRLVSDLMGWETLVISDPRSIKHNPSVLIYKIQLSNSSQIRKMVNLVYSNKFILNL